MNGIIVLQRIRTEIVPQRLRGNHIRILVKYLVDPRRTQLPILAADKQIRTVRVPHLQVFPDGIDNLITKIDQPMLVALADNPKLLGRQVNLAQFQIDALTAPDPGISIERDNAKVPLASAFQKTLAERLHVLFSTVQGLAYWIWIFMKSLSSTAASVCLPLVIKYSFRLRREDRWCFTVFG